MPSIIDILQAETWVLDGPASTPPIEAGTATLQFEADRVHGNSPCNTYMGSFELDGDSISVGPLASTMMACREELMAAERAYLTALDAVHTVAIADGTLTLSGGGITLTFDAVDLDDALARTWSIVSVASGDAIRSVVIDSEPALTLDSDGTASIETGCSSATTTWKRDGRALSFGPIDRSEISCEAELAVQEEAIVAALASTETFDVEPATLTLLDGEGHIALTATASDP